MNLNSTRRINLDIISTDRKQICTILVTNMDISEIVKQNNLEQSIGSENVTFIFIRNLYCLSLFRQI